MAPEATTGMLEAEAVAPGEQSMPGIIIYRFCADLFYANCNLFADDIMTLVSSAPESVKCVVVDCSAITDIDYSAAQVVRDVLQRLHARGITVLFGRVAPFFLKDMERHHIIAVLGKDNIYMQLHTALASARKLCGGAKAL